MNANTIKQLANKSKQYLPEYDFVGIRVQTELHGLNTGDVVTHRSSVWEDGEIIEPHGIDGVCAIDVNQAHRLSEYTGYDGDVYLVLGSNNTRGGNDTAEIIMREAVVIEIVIK